MPLEAFGGTGTVHRTKLLTGLLLLAMASGCEPTATTDDAVRDADVGSSTTAVRGSLDGRDLVLERDGQREVVATVAEGEGEPISISVRPGDHDHTTVLALTQSEAEEAHRYELRYLVVDEDGASELYGLPSRLQVSERVTGHREVAPTPVWSPDGDTIAWVEARGRAGMRLRTLGWRDLDGRSNPSEASEAFRLDGVPAGTQLRSCERGDDGEGVLHGRHGDDEWRIHLDGDEPRAVAMRVDP